MEILLIRHAEPDYAHDSLTPNGIEQARQLAAGLADVRIDEIYVSPLGRAQQTCVVTAQEKHLTPIRI